MFHGSYELSGGSIFEQQHGMDEVAITLPLTWTADGAQGEGTFRSNRVVSPGNVIRAASGKLRLAGGECSFEGCAASEFWQGEALRFSGECSRTPGWGLSGEYVLDKVVLEKPLPAAAVLPGPTVADMRFSGGVSGRGTFGFSAAGSDWSCELTAADGTLEAPGMVLKKLHGTIRLPGAGSGTRNPGGELRFGEIATLEDIIEIWTTKNYDPYTGDNPILQGLDSIRLFFVRLYDTVVELINLLADIFRNVKYLLPWNAVPGYGSDSGSAHGGGEGWVGGR